jgi:hypothetical protein
VVFEAFSLRGYRLLVQVVEDIGFESTKLSFAHSDKRRGGVAPVEHFKTKGLERTQNIKLW